MRDNILRRTIFGQFENFTLEVLVENRMLNASIRLNAYNPIAKCSHCFESSENKFLTVAIIYDKNKLALKF